jgi:hypothetical protein
VLRRCAVRTLDRQEVISLIRLRYLLFLLAALGLTAAASLQGKSAPVDILIMSTSDGYGELAPCG